MYCGKCQIVRDFGNLKPPSVSNVALTDRCTYPYSRADRQRHWCFRVMDMCTYVHFARSQDNINWLRLVTLDPTMYTPWYTSTYTCAVFYTVQKQVQLGTPVCDVIWQMLFTFPICLCQYSEQTHLWFEAVLKYLQLFSWAKFREQLL